MVKHACEWITKQFMCERIVEWTHSTCKTLNIILEQNLMHNKKDFLYVIENPT